MKIQQPINEYYEELAPNYDQDRFGNTYGQYIHQQETAILNQLLPYPATTLTLDLGCGTGRLLRWATHGLDYSPAMIAQAEKKYPDRDLQIGSAWDTPYETACFQAVYSFHVLMHLEEAQIPAVLQEAARILQSGGRFIFDIPSKKRRALLRYRAGHWHGAQSLALDDIRAFAGEDWEVRSYTGVLFLPIHRFPNWLRQPLRWMDDLLCRSPWRAYASYLVIELVRK
ncbi:MAG: class I SAM-dependent methyltransferase [Bacteroidota bacterium]